MKEGAYDGKELTSGFELSIENQGEIAENGISPLTAPITAREAVLMSRQQRPRMEWNF